MENPKDRSRDGFSQAEHEAWARSWEEEDDSGVEEPWDDDTDTEEDEDAWDDDTFFDD